MTFPGLGGQQPAPQNASPAGQLVPGVTPGVSKSIVIANTVIVAGPTGAVVGLFIYATGTTPGPGNGPVFWATNQSADPYGNAVTPTAGVSGTGQFSAGDTDINASGTFTYSGTPAAGNLVESSAPASGVDGSGNNFVAGQASYGATFATSLSAGFIQFYTGSLSGGWSASASIAIDALGDMAILAAVGRSILTNNQTLDDGSGNMTVAAALACASLTVGGSSNTGSGNNGGITSGPSGTVSSFPAAGPNHTHTEIHQHPF